MTNNTENTTTTQLILNDFELAQPEKPLSEQELLEYVAEAISYMIENRKDFLMSLLYRLDVSESNIATAFLPGNPEPAHLALARTVIERQKQRVATKQAHKQQNPSMWDWDLE